MKKTWCMALGVIGCLLLFSYVFTVWKLKTGVTIREYQHEVNQEANASVGPTEVSPDGKIDEQFVTHLPLVILEVDPDSIPNIYEFSEDGTAKVYSEQGMENPDPWVPLSVSLIDNDNYENHLTDVPALASEAKIKLRGMTSRSFEKKQYGIKFMDGEQEREISVLGMEADEDWVLSNSILDLSGVRNYAAMNIGGQIFPFTPETRFCEVVFKVGDEYTYQGLYLLTEKVKKSEGVINIDDFREDAASLSYVVCRDRKDYTKLTLSTWASDHQICYGYFDLVYPAQQYISEQGIARIEEELSRIEYILYSEEPEEFMQYKQYLDVDSFVDYFIINEFFMNYDAGNNSTYYYKTRNGRLAMGPLWDFDNSADNYYAMMSDKKSVPFVSQPWFERLIRDEEFQKKVNARYKELRETVLSDEYVEQFIDETMAYLGNARMRDYSRWKASYEQNHMLDVVEDTNGFAIDRNTGSVEGEVQRFKDTLFGHAQWMDKNLDTYLLRFADETVSQAGQKQHSEIAAIGVLCFLIMIVLIMRRVKGELR